MMNNQVYVEDGNLILSENILLSEKEWSFINEDPQLIFHFDKEIIGVRIQLEFTKLIEKPFYVKVYYRSTEENFSENNVICFNRFFPLKSTTDVIFPKNVQDVRLDLNEENSQVFIDYLLIQPIYKKINPIEELHSIAFPYLQKDDQRKRVLIISHDLTNTGAPILALNIADKLKNKIVDILVLACSNKKPELYNRYIDKNIPVLFLDDFYKNEYCYFDLESSKLEFDVMFPLLIKMLKKYGFTVAILNTIVSGQIIKFLKNEKIKSISLIHEMKNTIQTYGFEDYGKLVAENADFIVFPDEIVLKDFKDLFSNINGNTFVRPQGIYLDKDIDRIYSFEEYGLDLTKPIVLGSGTAELRKGIDLFVSAAIGLCEIDDDVQFVWTGSFGGNIELKSWMEYQIEKSGFSKRILLLPFLSNPNEYKYLLKNITTFWLTSREDPFPSVVLEAMKFHKPVIGFRNSGGFISMARNNRAYAIEDFSINSLINETKCILDKGSFIDWNSVDSFIEGLSLDEYITFLNELIIE